MSAYKKLFAMVLACLLNFFVVEVRAQNPEPIANGIIPFIGENNFSNVVVFADANHSQLFKPEFNNNTSNTNLFSVSELEKLKELELHYKNVSTNSPPRGAVFLDMQPRAYLFSIKSEKKGKIVTEEKKNEFYVARFAYANGGGTEEIFFLGARQIITHFRDRHNAGYDAVIIDNQVSRYIEYKNGKIDGLYVTFGSEANNAKTNNKSDLIERPGRILYRWARFSDGRIIGNLLDWDVQGNLITYVEFKEPFDFLKHTKGKFDLSWDVVIK